MAKITYFDNNQGFYSFEDVEDYTLTRGTTTYTLELNGAYDPERQAYKIVFAIEGLQTFNPPGDYSGIDMPVEGTITAVTMYNDSDEKIMEITGLKADLVPINLYLLEDEGYNLFQDIYATDFKITGADGNGRASGWDGDDISTGSLKDVVKAGDGNDYIKDQGGKDVYIGGDGWDTVSYEDAIHNPGRGNKGIVVNLKKGVVKGPDGNTDKVKSIEMIRGTNKNDKFTGSNGNDGFYGNAGKDNFNGGKGWDWVNYGREDDRGGFVGIDVDLSTGIGYDTFGQKDKLKKIEQVVGSVFDDVIRDDAKDNELRGGDGDDALHFSQGNDVAEGGEGADVFYFHGDDFGFDAIKDFEDGVDRIQITEATQFEDLTITADDEHIFIEFGTDNRIQLTNAVFEDGLVVGDITSADFIWTMG